jgi:hypothetical protein
MWKDTPFFLGGLSVATEWQWRVSGKPVVGEWWVSGGLEWRVSGKPVAVTAASEW